MTDMILKRIEAARNGTNPTAISRMPSGFLVLCDQQFLSGYCILLADPPVSTLNDLDYLKRLEFLSDMALVGDVLTDITGAYRINYVIAGNTDPWLHAHIVPRYLSEPEQYRKDLPWSHPKEERDSILFNLERDRPLMDKISRAIEKQLPH